SNDPAPEVRAAVVKDIARLGCTDEVREVLVQGLLDAEADVRMHAAQGVRYQEDPVIVNALRGAIQDPDEDVRRHVLDSLGTTGAAGQAAATDIIATLRDRESKVRIAALGAVANLRLHSARARGEVIRLLGAENFKELRQALRTAQAVGEFARGTPAMFDAALPLVARPEQDLGALALSAAWSAANNRPEQRGRLAVRSSRALGDDRKNMASHASACLKEWLDKK